MKTVTVRSFDELEWLLKKDERERARAVRRAVYATARDGARALKRAVPVAFGELRESIHAERSQGGARTVVDAPHAVPIEVGARPHWVPIEPLLKWVKLRAAQGLLTPRQVGRLPGTTTQAHAVNLAGQLRAMERAGSLEVDAPMRLARAIQTRLAKSGSRPHWYARSSLPAMLVILDQRIHAALREDG